MMRNIDGCKQTILLREHILGIKPSVFLKSTIQIFHDNSVGTSTNVQRCLLLTELTTQMNFL